MTLPINLQTAGAVARWNTTAPVEGLGTAVNTAANRVKGYWNFAVQGGATGTAGLGLVDDQGAALILPTGAIVTNFMVYVITAPVGASGTIAFKLLSTADLMAATAITSLTIGVVWQGKPVTGGAAAAWTVVGPVTAVAGTQPVIVIATTAMTAGKLGVYIDYIDGN